MSVLGHHQEFVKTRLFQFILDNFPGANLKAIDDIVLDYVISIINESSIDACFDAEGFIEMMSAYVPEFASIDPTKVCTWVVELEAELSQKEESDAMSNLDDSAGSDKVSLTLQSLSEMLPSITKANRSHSNSESSETAETTRMTPMDTKIYLDKCRALHEMFPNTAYIEIKHCVSIALGDVERATATLLHRQETGQALTAGALPAAQRPPPCNDSELKNRIIARYSYVDKNSDTKEHRPLAPKIEPKKMVRYRDNKIVSLKGERYTEVPKSGLDEEHLKKPKKQHCP